MKCPLCLNTLGPTSKLLRFCLKHPDKTERVTVSDHEYGNVFCPGTDEHGCPPSAVEKEPILLHVGCPYQNPFVTKSGFLIPPSVWYDSDAGFEKLESWQLETPRALQREDGSRAEMWFPLSLFLATNVPQEGSRNSTVLMLGEQEAGKSVLATMAIRDDTWQAEDSFSRGFVYVSPKKGIVYAAGDTHDDARADEYIKHLAATVRVDGKMPEATQARDRNIRALFLSVDHVAAAEETVDIAPQKAGFSLTRLVKDILPKPPDEQSEASVHIKRPPPTTPRNQSVVTFYDVAGEQTTVAVDEQIIRLGEHFDRCAVVLDVLQLSCFGGSRQRENNPKSTNANSGSTEPAFTLKGLETAFNNLHRLRKEGDKHCLVITKLDLLRGKQTASGGGEAVKERVRAMLSSGRYPKFADFRQALEMPDKYEPTSETGEKEILIELLRASDTRIEKTLYNHLNQQDSCPVFFVWTEGLDEGPPYSVGIHRFVRNWCLQQKSSTKVKRA